MDNENSNYQMNFGISYKRKKISRYWIIEKRKQKIWLYNNQTPIMINHKLITKHLRVLRIKKTRTPPKRKRKNQIINLVETVRQYWWTTTCQIRKTIHFTKWSSENWKKSMWIWNCWWITGLRKWHLYHRMRYMGG